ncbi:unnamed protein product [Cuscuta epithymum]|uniref:Uncharacterized protein n=1 Tax=Cuscuta epithymum TaxID=186058 RepID=A0AAV0C1Z1_9ASTE|nr:unnamed protein product [Cuscuta epithymum]
MHDSPSSNSQELHLFQQFPGIQQTAPPPPTSRNSASEQTAPPPPTSRNSASEQQKSPAPPSIFNTSASSKWGRSDCLIFTTGVVINFTNTRLYGERRIAGCTVFT